MIRFEIVQKSVYKYAVAALKIEPELVTICNDCLVSWGNFLLIFN